MWAVALPTTELGRRFDPDCRLSRSPDRSATDPRILITPTASFATELTFLQSISNKKLWRFRCNASPMFLQLADGRQLGRYVRGTPFNSIVEMKWNSRGPAEQTGPVVDQPTELMLDLPDEALSLRLASVRLAPWQAESSSLLHRTTGTLLRS
jgi:hypothetical protein